MKLKRGGARVNPELIITRSARRPAYVGKFGRLDRYIIHLPSGSIFYTADMKKRFHMSSGRTVGGLLKQRDDVERACVNKGMWRKK